MEANPFLELIPQQDINVLLAKSKWPTLGKPRILSLSHAAKKYGPEIVRDFNVLIRNPYRTLEETAGKYGFTREYARLLVKRFYGRPYGFFKKQKKADFRVDLSCNRHPLNKEQIYQNGTFPHIGATIEVEAYRILTDLGFKVSCGDTITSDLIVNGWRVDVKSVTTSHKTSKRSLCSYYSFHATPKQIKICHFFILHAIQDNRWFVTPNTGKRDYNIRREVYPLGRKGFHKKSSCNNKYENAWHLLATPKESPNV